MARKPPSNRTNRRRRPGNSTGPDTDTSREGYKVGPGYPPKEHQFKPGQSGNPKGARRKRPSIGPELKALFERALSKNVTLKQGEKERIVSSAAAGFEQFSNQFAKGDRHARRDLMTLIGVLGFDVAGQPEAIQEALAPDHQAILDAYVARQKDVEAPSRPPPVFAPPALLDDDSENSQPK
jgi:hypothetical protein